jgi:hypothetical protein
MGIASHKNAIIASMLCGLCFLSGCSVIWRATQTPSPVKDYHLPEKGDSRATVELYWGQPIETVNNNDNSTTCTYELIIKQSPPRFLLHDDAVQYALMDWAYIGLPELILTPTIIVVELYRTFTSKDYRAIVTYDKNGIVVNEEHYQTNAIKTPPYTISPAVQAVLSSYQGFKANFVGAKMTLLAQPSMSPVCGKDSIITPDGLGFSFFTSEALNSELSAAGFYDSQNGPTLTVIYTECNLINKPSYGKSTWAIGFSICPTTFNCVDHTTRYEFGSQTASYKLSAPNCKESAEAFIPALSQALLELVSSQQFASLVLRQPDSIAIVNLPPDEKASAIPPPIVEPESAELKPDASAQSPPPSKGTFLPPEAVHSRSKKSLPKLAVLPIFFQASAQVTNPSAVTRTVIETLKKVLRNRHDFEASDSFYDLGKDLNARKINTDIINEDSVNVLFNTESLFSWGSPLNYEQIQILARKLNVDIIFLFRFGPGRGGGAHSDVGILYTYLVDVTHRKNYFDTNVILNLNSPAYLSTPVEKFFSRYQEKEVD